ncbi:P-loop containing nucleoside triphosphate hydrolase protein [Dioscorea alata]|uniref:P-loop containing nucleoside triphosphate hydrolase protein n=1 Tax=Dioscorea alata TaxID=55571 RepID=A0ACB7V7G7_DIOAL|nr:P-loop containing nucleoside triphosphate hydrolase protein [Dioscorea alata]
MHLKEMEAVKAGMPVVSVRHDGDGGSAAKDIHMEDFNISVDGRDLITDASVTLSFGRHYGLVGRNGTGKTSFLRHMAMHVFMVFLGTAKYYMWNKKLWEIIHQLCSVSLMLILKGHSCWKKKPSYFLNREIWSMKLNLGIMDILKGASTKMLFQKGLKKCIKGSNSLMHMQQRHVLLQFLRWMNTFIKKERKNSTEK